MLPQRRESPFKLRNFTCEQLISILPTLQGQFDSLLAFDASPKDLSNGIINSAFAMLYKDFVRLYIFYQTAIIRLLELYFEVNQVKRANELFEAYKKFLVRMDKVSDFMRVIDSVGMDKSDMPNVSRAPSLSLKLLEKHLRHLESTSKRNNPQPFARIQSVELPRIGYTTLQGRRRSLRTPSKQIPDSINTNSRSPGARLSHKRSDNSFVSERSELTIDEASLFDKKKQNCDIGKVELTVDTARYQQLSGALPYDLLTNGSYDYVTLQPDTDKTNSDDQQKDLIVMTDPGEPIDGASTSESSTRCQMTRVQPAEWVQVEL